MELFLAIPLLFLSAVFSGSETALYSLSRVRIDYLVQQGDRRARLMRWLTKPLGPSIISILIANNISAELLTRISAHSLRAFGAWSVLLTALILTPILLICGEFIPKWWARQQADGLMYALSYFLVVLRIVLAPIVWICQMISKVIQVMLPGGPVDIWEPSASRPNLRTFIRAPQNQQVVTPVQQRLIDRVLALDAVSLSYRGIRKPLEVVQALDDQQTVEQALANLGPKYYQRYLVSKRQSPYGWVSAQALVSAEPSCRLSELARPLPRLASDTPLHNALQRMQEEGAEMVLVVDEAQRPHSVAFRGDCLRVLMQL